VSHPPSIPTDTNLITELDVATAALLATRQGEVWLNGLKSLTPDVARELARFQGDWIYLRGLTSLPVAVAEALFPIAGKTCIGGPDYDECDEDFSVAHLFGSELDPCVAKFLAERCAGGIYVQYTIPEHTHIGLEAAAFLGSIENDKVTLTIRSIKTLDNSILAAIACFRGFLRLPQLEEITIAQAREFAAKNVSLEVATTTCMATDAVRELLKSGGRIELHGSDLLERHAPAFAEAKCILNITGGTVLGENAARHLAIANCPSITLWVDAIEDAAARALSSAVTGALKIMCQALSDKAAAALARFSGMLGLSALECLRSTPGHVALATKLAQQCTAASHALQLHSIKSLGRGAAKAIAETPAPAIQLGLEGLPSDVATELARFNGSLTMLSLDSISVDVAAVLVHGKLKSLHVGCKSMECDVSHILAGHGLASLGLGLPAGAVSPELIKVLGSGAAIHLMLDADSIASPVVDAIVASPQLSTSFSRFKELNGWPLALPKNGLLRGVESVHVVGENPGLAKISDIGFTPRFPWLKLLEIAKCPDIRELDFRGPANADPVHDSPLCIQVTQCDQLEKVTIMTERCCASNLKLAALPSCREVHMSLPDLADLSVLSGIKSIKKLGLYRSPMLKSLEDARSLEHLTHLFIVDCPRVESLKGLEGLNNLESLHLENCPGINDLQVVAGLPSLKVLALHGETEVVSLHCLRHSESLELQLPSAAIGLPPSLVKRAYSFWGTKSLWFFKNARIECQHCGGQQFQGTCHGQHARIESAVVSRSAPLDGGDYLGSAKALFHSLESDLQSSGLEDVVAESVFERFPVLHATVTCVACDSAFDPASFGADADSAMGGNWSEIGKERDGDSSIQQSLQMVVDFSVDPKGAKRPAPEAGRCPICCDAPMQLVLAGRAQKRASGKFRGHVSLDRAPWSELPNSFFVDEGDEKVEGSWEWSHAPQASSGMRIACANACFESPVPSPQQVPHVLLAILAIYEAQKEQPNLELLAVWVRDLAHEGSKHEGMAMFEEQLGNVDADPTEVWIRALWSHIGNEESMVEGAMGHLDNCRPEYMPWEPASDSPTDAADELYNKALALLRQALRLSKQQEPPQKQKTRSRSRPKAKKPELHGAEGPLAGRVFCFTGRLEGMSRADAESKVKALGAATAASITKKVTDVVVGEDAGTKRAKALEMGLEVHDQEAFEALFRGLA
jgi:hypothetical protein